ncbi:MAG: hypothetical protein JXQ75_16560 [Phycisphaerae bacterium]|nr:hypothetical protein [Phycisphaerae bacterium]
MELDIRIDRSKSSVQEAILQFAARRGYHLSHPWHCEGPRIEDRRSRLDPVPRIDLVICRKQGSTIVTIRFRSHRGCTELAYALRIYLSHGSAYDCLCPPICSRCSAPVTNIVATYCGRCGTELLPGLTNVSPPPVPMVEDKAADGPPGNAVVAERTNIDPESNDAERSSTYLGEKAVSRKALAED